MRDLHHVYNSLGINDSNNDSQEEAQHGKVTLFLLEQPKVKEQLAVAEWPNVEEQVPVMQYLIQFLKNFKRCNSRLTGGC